MVSVNSKTSTKVDELLDQQAQASIAYTDAHDASTLAAAQSYAQSLATTRTFRGGVAYGHSYLSASPSDGAYIWFRLWATAVGGSYIVSNGLFGSRLIDDWASSKGGFAKVLQTLQITGDIGKNPAQYMSPQVGPFVSVWGYNDAHDTTTANGANIAAINTAYLYAFRTVISFAQAAWKCDAGDTTYTTLTGSWSNQFSQNNNVGWFYKKTSTGGDKITITTPAGFRGGVVALRMITNKSGGSVPASTVTCKVDGANSTPIGFPSNAVSTQLTSTIAYGQVPLRFNLSSGSHTIEITAQTGGMAYDGFHIESTVPRPIMWANIARTPACTSTQLSSLAALNDTIETASSEFQSGSLVIVDINAALNNNSAYFGADNIHPNDAGHIVIARAFVDAWAQYPFATYQDIVSGGELYSPSSQQYTLLAWYAVGGPRGTITPPADGAAYYVPFIAEVARTFSGIRIDVTSIATVGAVARLGVYAEDWNAKPGVLIYDCGTVPVDSTGAQTITGLTLLLTGRFWLCVNIQGASTLRPTLVSVTGPTGGIGIVSGTDLSQGGGWTDSRTMTSGALPAAAWPGTVQAVPLVALRS